MMNKEQVCRHFGKMSKNYNDYAMVQKKMASSLEELVKNTGTFHRILEIGCGTGHFTKTLAQLYPHSQIIATDISPGMLKTAKENLSHFKNISYQLEDGENLELSGPFDLIISNAAFQWFQDYQLAFQHFFHLLQPGGYLLYATFGNNTFEELNTSFAAAHLFLDLKTSAHHGLRFISIESLGSISKELGFIARHHEVFYKEYFPTVKDFLTSVKKVGANNASHSKNMVINRHLMFAMMKYYEENFKDDNQIPVTYHAIYGCEQKPAL